MQQKHFRLINVLMKDRIVSASFIASELGISTRTVFSQIKEISHEFPDLIAATYKGYCIDRNKATKLLNANIIHFPEEKEERILYILFKLLYESKQEHCINNLSSELYISTSLVKSYIPKIKEILEKYGISLIIKNNCLSIISNEAIIRKTLISLCYESSKSNYIDIDTLHYVYANIDVQFIVTSVDSLISNNAFFTTDYARNNFIMNIVMMIYRNKTKHIDDSKVVGNFKYKDLSIQFSKVLSNHYGISLTESDIYHIDLFIQTYTISHSKKLNIELSSEYILKFKNLVDTIFHRLIENYNYKFDDISSEHFTEVLYHLLKRVSNGITLTSPVKNTIRYSAPLTYEIAVFVAHVIKEETGLILSRDEIAYLATNLIEGAIEIENKSFWKIEAILICPNYYDFSKKLLNTLNLYFSKYIDIKRVFHNENEIKEDDTFDLILTAVPLIHFHKQNSLLINMSLSEYDIYTIQSTITKVYQNESLPYLNRIFNEILPEDLFILDESAENKEEALEIIFKSIEKKYPNGVNKIKSSVLEREDFSPTSLEFVSIPCPIEYINENNFLCVYINKNGILWDNQFIYIVLLPCCNTNENHLTCNILSPIYHSFMSTTFINSLINSNSASDFKKEIIRYIVFGED